MPLRFLTAGESHGPAIAAILEGLPAGVPVDRERLNIMLARRQSGFGSGGRMRIEADEVRISSGVLSGRTTGGPICVTIRNRDWANWRDKDVAPMTVPRPGHADLTAALKYGYEDLRVGLERSSARETAARVVVGALCLELLRPLGVEVGGVVLAIGDVDSAGGSSMDVLSEAKPVEAADNIHALPSLRESAAATRALWLAAEASPVRCPDQVASERMVAAIRAAAAARDTLGGVIEVVALGVPPGLGSHVHWDRRLTGRILGALGSIPSVKGVEIGPAFENAALRGTQVHDRFRWQDEGESGRVVRRAGQRGGGTEGGISTGEPLVVRLALKPISTTLTPLHSVDLATGERAETRYERSDICAVPRAVVVAEAMLAFVLADALLEKLGGDSFAAICERASALPRGTIQDFHLAGTPWRLDLDEP